MRTDGSVNIEIKGKTEKLEKALEKARSISLSAAKAIGAAFAAVSAAAVGMGAVIVSEYANYEQLVGGVETLFGTGGKTLEDYAESVGKTVSEVSGEYARLEEAENNVMANAANAYKTAGLSANAYMEQVTSFSAALISSLGGDTLKAAEVADQAIIDMSDNANKMGTAMQSIQDAYNGFAKQNYTMLDNLKLGYGGTQAEMQRLLTDAEKISGIHYDMSSYADIINAIHVIQTEMGITGTTALEAEKTISGSIGMLKASVQNLIAGLGNAEADVRGLIDMVVDSFNSVVENITPIVDNIISALPSAFEKISDALADLLSELLSTTATAASELITVMAESINENLPVIIDAATEIISTIIDTVTSLIPDLDESAQQIIEALCTFIVDNIEDITQAAIDIITALAGGLGDALPVLIPAAVDAVFKIADTILDNIDTVLATAKKILDGLADALTDEENMKKIAAEVPSIVTKIIASLTAAIPEVISFAVDFFDSIAEDLVNYDWGNMAREVMENIANSIEEALNLPVLKEARAYMAVAIDNILTGGEVYGGNIENYSDSAVDSFMYHYRDGIDTVADAIGDGAAEIAEHYNDGKEIINEAANDFWHAGENKAASVISERKVNGMNAPPDLKVDPEGLEETADNISDSLSSISETAENTAAKTEKSADRSTAAVKKSISQISDEFKRFYDDLNLQLAKGNITEEQYYSTLADKLNSSSEYNTAAYTSYWKKVSDYNKKAADKAADEIEKSNSEILKRQNEAAKKRLEKQKEIANAELKQFLDNANKLTVEYKSKIQTVQNERDSFKNRLSENVFSMMEITDERTGETKKIGGVVNFQKKIASRNELINHLESLVKKGIPKGMLSEIAAMDPEEGLQFAKQLDGMNTDKWKSLVADYNEYEKTNEKIDRVYSPLLTELNNKYADDLYTLIDGVTTGAAAGGAKAVKEFLKGFDLSSEDAVSVIGNKISEVFDSISNSVSDGSFFDADKLKTGGENIAENIALGIVSKSDVIRNALKSALESADLMTSLKAAVDLNASSLAPAGTSQITNVTNVNNNYSGSLGQSRDKRNIVISLDANLVWKDGSKLAEIVNSENKKFAVTVGG